MMRKFWIDIDNPPQAQYLSPIANGLRNRGHSVFLTARDHGPTLDVLANRGESAVAVGGLFGESRISKARGTIARAFQLKRLAARSGQIEGMVSTSRSGVIAARMLGLPAFTVLDYEGVELDVYRRTRTMIVHPSVIPSRAFTDRGFPRDRLRPFEGLKEDLAFSDLSTQGIEPARLPPPRDLSLKAILVRPPSESSHYRSHSSIKVMELILNDLSSRKDVQTIFAPRTGHQITMMSSRDWKVPPVILERPLPLVPLMNAVDWVVTGGGTMLREAAWLGVPALTVFQGPMPAVDRWLESVGAIRHVTDAASLSQINWLRPEPSSQIGKRPGALDTVLDLIEGADLSTASSSG